MGRLLAQLWTHRATDGTRIVSPWNASKVFFSYGTIMLVRKLRPLMRDETMVSSSPVSKSIEFRLVRIVLAYSGHFSWWRHFLFIQANNLFHVHLISWVKILLFNIFIAMVQLEVFFWGKVNILKIFILLTLSGIVPHKGECYLL